MSDAHKGKAFSLEHRMKLSESMKGRVFTAEHRAKLSDALKYRLISPETRQKMSDAHKGEKNHWYGIRGQMHPLWRIPRTPETIAKMSEANRGIKNPNYGKRGVLSPNFGKHPTAESRTKNSRAHLGIKLSQETRENISKGHIGVVFSPEQRAKLSAANRGKNNPNYGRTATIETRNKMSNSRRGERNGHYGMEAAHGLGSWFTHPDGYLVWLRSTYEVRTANALSSLKVAWIYEPSIFELGGATYRPDFYLPMESLFWEVKGYMRKPAKSKLIRFIELYPDLNFRIIRLPEIKRLEDAVTNNTPVDIRALGNQCID